MANIGANIFSDFTRLAMEHKSINLGQGFPVGFKVDFAVRAIQNALSQSTLNNQYCRPGGHLSLVHVLADIYSPLFNRKLDPLKEVVTSVGAQQVLFEAQMALVNEGEEVMVIEPYFDACKKQ